METDDFTIMVNQLKTWREGASVNASNGYSPFCNPKHRYILAIDHAIDVVASIKRRFVDGQSHDDSVFFRYFEELK